MPAAAGLVALADDAVLATGEALTEVLLELLLPQPATTSATPSTSAAAIPARSLVILPFIMVISQSMVVRVRRREKTPAGRGFFPLSTLGYPTRVLTRALLFAVRGSNKVELT